MIVPSNLVGLAARRVLGADRGLANVAFLTPYALAERLGRPGAAAADSRQLTEPILLAAIRMELRSDPGMFAAVANHAATERALALRYAELSRARPETRDRIRRAGSVRARALVDLFARVGARVAGYADEDALARYAHHAVSEDAAAVRSLGTVVLHLPQPLAPALHDLVAAVRQARPSVAIVGITGDDAADAAVRAECARMGLVLPTPDAMPDATKQVTEPRPCAGPRSSARRTSTRRSARSLAVSSSWPPRACRSIASRFSPRPSSPIPGPSTRTSAPRAFPHNGPAVRMLADTMAGRMLDRLVHLVGENFARHELVALFASTPVRTSDGEAVPIDRWDRISRRAGVVDGDDWETRLAAHCP